MPSPIQVNFGRINNNPLAGFNQSTGMLSRAIADLETRSNKRTEIAGEGFKGLQKMAVESDTRKILEDTKKNQLQQGLSDRYDNMYGTLYTDTKDENGNTVTVPTVGSTPQEQASLDAQRQQFDAGFLGSIPGQTNTKQQNNMAVFNKNLDNVLDPAAYSGAVHDEMLKAGINADVADAERKKQAARYAAPGMTDRQKLEYDARVKLAIQSGKTRDQAIQEAHKYSVAGGDKSGGTGSSKKKGANGKHLNLKDSKQYYMDSGFEDSTYVGGDAGDVAKSHINLSHEGYSDSDVQWAVNNLGSDSLDLFNNENTVGWSVWNKSEKTEHAMRQMLESNKKAQDNKAKNLAGGTTGGYTQSSGIRDAAGMHKEQELSQSQTQQELNAIFAGSGRPSEKSILDAMFSGINGVGTKAKKKVLADAKKEVKDQKKAGNASSEKDLLQDAVKRKATEEAEKARVAALPGDGKGPLSSKLNPEQSKSAVVDPITGYSEYKYTGHLKGRAREDAEYAGARSFYKDKAEEAASAIELLKQTPGDDMTRSAEITALQAEQRHYIDQGKLGLSKLGTDAGRVLEDVGNAFGDTFNPYSEENTKRRIIDQGQEIWNKRVLNREQKNAQKRSDIFVNGVVDGANAGMGQPLPTDNPLSDNQMQMVQPPMRQPLLSNIPTGGQTQQTPPLPQGQGNAPAPQVDAITLAINKGQIAEAMPYVQRMQPAELRQLLDQLRQDDPSGQRAAQVVQMLQGSIQQ